VGWWAGWAVLSLLSKILSSLMRELKNEQTTFDRATEPTVGPTIRGPALAAELWSACALLHFSELLPPASEEGPVSIPRLNTTDAFHIPRPCCQLHAAETLE